MCSQCHSICFYVCALALVGTLRLTCCWQVCVEPAYSPTWHWVWPNSIQIVNDSSHVVEYVTATRFGLISIEPYWVAVKQAFRLVHLPGIKYHLVMSYVCYEAVSWQWCHGILLQLRRNAFLRKFFLGLMLVGYKICFEPHLLYHNYAFKNCNEWILCICWIDSLGSTSADFSKVCQHYLGRWVEVVSVVFSLISLLGAVVVYWVLMSNFLFHSVSFIYGLWLAIDILTIFSYLICCH